MKKNLKQLESTILALLTALVFISGSAQAQSDKPNIILLVSDDTGYGDLGPYGGGEGRGMPTPNIDRLAAEGMTLFSFYAQPSCTPGRAAMQTGRIVQCGTQNRSSDYALTARDYIKSGELGDIVAVHIKELLDGPVPFVEKEDTRTPDTIDWDMWLGPAPKVPYNVSRNKSWGCYWDYSGGQGGEMIHQLDLARLVLDDPGFPKSVYCAGGRYFFNDNREVPDYQLATFDYGNFALTLEAGACTPYMKKSGPEIRFTDDFPEWRQNATRIEIIGTKRMMYVGRMGGGWQVFDKDKQIVAQESGYYPLKPHIKNFIDCMRSRNQPNGNIVEGHNSSVLIHLANLSYRAGNKQLLFSPEYETITNSSEAQALSRQHYRKGFEVNSNV